MTKYMKQTSKVDEEETTTSPTVLTHTALGTFKDEKTGRWCLAKIRYNPQTNETGEYEIIANEEGSKDAVNYRFKINCVKEGII